MRLALALAFVLGLAAIPSFATTYNVTNDANLATAMSSAVGGDVVNIAAGSYTVKPVPANSGTAGNPIRIVGSQSSPASMSFSVGLDWASGTRSYISWTGLKFSDDVTFTRADHCSLTYCKVDSGGFMSFGGSSDPASDGISTENYIGYTTFRQNIGAGFVVKFLRTTNTLVDRCRFFGTTTAADFEMGRGRYLYRSQGNTFRDCMLSMECWGAENGEQYVQGIRDTSKNNTFDTDTIWVGMTSKRSRRVLLSQAGSFPGTATPNYWVGCDYRSFHETSTDNAFEFQDGTGGGVYNCVFASRMGRPLTFPGSAATPGLVLRHVTAYSSGQQAFRHDNSLNPTGSRFNANAYAAGTTNTCGSTSTATFMLQTLGAFASSDSNAFFPRDVAYTFVKAGGGTVCYTLAAWRSASGNEAASAVTALDATVFADTAWATLDLRPASGSSPLISASAPGGYYGAFDWTEGGGGTTPSECTCPPADVFDLRMYYRREGE